MKLLLVEDEIKTVDYLKRGLSEQGYNVDIAMNGLDGLHLAGTGQYEAIILDIMLPDLDGISLLKSIRPTNHTPVIMLTAKDALSSRLEAFNAGNYADCKRRSQQPFGGVQRRSRRLSYQTFFVFGTAGALAGYHQPGAYQRTDPHPHRRSAHRPDGASGNSRKPPARPHRQRIFPAGGLGSQTIANRFQNRHHRTGLGHLF